MCSVQVCVCALSECVCVYLSRSGGDKVLGQLQCSLGVLAGVMTFDIVHLDLLPVGGATGGGGGVTHMLYQEMV